MIDLTKFAEFNKHITTLEETSCDTHNKCYLTNSKKAVINFDKVKEDHSLEIYKCDNQLCSNDALFLDKNGCVTFIEFKNGFSRSDVSKLKQKIVHSLLIFTDITGTSLTFVHENLNYIFVYDENKKNIKKASNRTDISTKLTEYGNTQFKGKGVMSFAKVFFKNAYEYTKADFCIKSIKHL